MSNTIEIKKVLYKEKPNAQTIKEYEDSRIYKAETSLGSIVFEVPYSDMGRDGKFEKELPAQLLIRWLVTGNNMK